MTATNASVDHSARRRSRISQVARKLTSALSDSSTARSASAPMTMIAPAPTAPPTARAAVMSSSAGTMTKIQGSAIPACTSTKCRMRRLIGSRSRRAYFDPDWVLTPRGMNVTINNCAANTARQTMITTSDDGPRLARARPPATPPKPRAMTDPMENTTMATGATSASRRETCSSVSRRFEPRTPLSNSRQRNQANARSCLIRRASP